MKRRLEQLLIGLLLACYPKRFREQFGAQIQADMDESRMERQSLPRWRRGWLATEDAWDMLKAMVNSHLHEVKKPQAVLAVAGGGHQGLRRVRLLDWKLIARRFPPMLGMFYAMIAGALGFVVYDYRQLAVAACLMPNSGLPQTRKPWLTIPAIQGTEATG